MTAGELQAGERAVTPRGYVITATGRSADGRVEVDVQAHILPARTIWIPASQAVSRVKPESRQIDWVPPGPVVLWEVPGCRLIREGDGYTLGGVPVSADELAALAGVIGGLKC